MYLVDSHAHLDFPTTSSSGGLRGASSEELAGVISRAKNNKVGSIITIGTSIECSRKCIEIAEKEKSLPIYATCGIHPGDGKADIGRYGSVEKCIDEMREVLRSPSITLRTYGAQNDNGRAHDDRKIVGIGECGLDYYLVKSDPSTKLRAGKGKVTSEEEKNFQRELFKAQIKLALDLNLPLIVHCRNAWDEIFNIISNLKMKNSKLTGVFHSWTGDVNAAKKALDLGFYISFSGIVTFKNASLVQDTARFVPLDRMLIETDSPFLAPEPFRGSKNEPKNVKIIADFLASLRNVSPSDIYSATAANAKTLFKFE